MLFGLANAPGIFQQLMSIVLGGLEQFSMAYLDNILVFSNSISEHLQHLQSLFNHLRNHGLKIKFPKCQFMMAETKYLEFVINKKGIKTYDDKAEVICSISELKTVRQVKGFIGAIGYYCRFIPAFSSMALIALTKEDARFKWTDDCQRLFDMLKDQLTTIPLLAYPNMNKPMMLYSDACDQCIRAYLTQPCPENGGPVPGIPEEIPIYFLSLKLSSTK